MSAARYLCSQLVWLVVAKPGSAADYHVQWVNLEEIWDGGAVLECEEEVTTGLPATISADEVTFSGHVNAVNRHEQGWRVELEFSPLTLWTIEKWRPEHALDAATLEGGK